VLRTGQYFKLLREMVVLLGMKCATGPRLDITILSEGSVVLLLIHLKYHFREFLYRTSLKRTLRNEVIYPI
jgi:hypothetical protein